MDGLVVVAHHDDAVLWMGGTIRHLRDWNWYIIALCLDMPHKVEGFSRSCKELRARSDYSTFSDYQDREERSETGAVDQMKMSLRRLVRGQEYDYVFTHSRSEHGEYSYHPNHADVCEAVRSIASETELIKDTGALVHFCYYPIYNLEKIGTVARYDADYYYQLTYDELAFKTDLIRSFDKDTVMNLERKLGAPCPNPEAFEGGELSLVEPFRRREEDAE